MSAAHQDRGCLAAFAAAVGHQAPFTDQELAAVASLTVTHAQELAPLAACTGLRHLRVIASEIADFLIGDALAELVHLEVHGSVVQSLLGLTFCRKLERVDLLFTSLVEARHLVGSPWRRGTLVGNPWSQQSWNLLDEVAAGAGMLIECSTTQEWQRTCQLWEQAGVCSGVLGGQELVVRPGLPRLTANPYDALRLGAATVRRALRSPTFSVEALFHDHHDRVDAPELTPLAHVHELGFQGDALRWIAEAALSAEDRAALATFVKRFPSIIFYRTSAEAIVALAQDGELPAWYTAVLGALDGWMPAQRRPPVRFAGFELTSSPRADRAATLIYHLGLREHGDDETGEAMRAAGFVPIGLVVEDPALMLAFRDDGTSMIYEYHDEDVRDAVAEGRDVAASIYPVFRSYASMLGHIVALHPPELEPILAQ